MKHPLLSKILLTLRFQGVLFVAGLFLVCSSGLSLIAHEPLPPNGPFQAVIPFELICWGFIVVGAGMVVWAVAATPRFNRLPRGNGSGSLDAQMNLQGHGFEKAALPLIDRIMGTLGSARIVPLTLGLIGGGQCLFEVLELMSTSHPSWPLVIMLGFGVLLGAVMVAWSLRESK